MRTKLTLRLEDHLISSAKNYARSAGKSLSEVVADYFVAVTSSSAPLCKETLTVSKLKGILKDTEVDGVEDYQTYLEEKHLRGDDR